MLEMLVPSGSRKKPRFQFLCSPLPVHPRQKKTHANQRPTYERYIPARDLNLRLIQRSAGLSDNHRRLAAGSGEPLSQHSRRSGAGSACPGSDTAYETGTVGNHHCDSGDSDSLRSAGRLSLCLQRPPLSPWWRQMGCGIRSRGPLPPARLWPAPPPLDGEGAAGLAMWRRWLWWSERRRSTLLQFPGGG